MEPMERRSGWHPPAWRSLRGSSVNGTIAFDGPAPAGTINFGLGQPSADLLPLELIREASDAYFREANPSEISIWTRSKVRPASGWAPFGYLHLAMVPCGTPLVVESCLLRHLKPTRMPSGPDSRLLLHATGRKRRGQSPRPATEWNAYQLSQELHCSRRKKEGKKRRTKRKDPETDTLSS